MRRGGTLIGLVGLLLAAVTGCASDPSASEADAQTAPVVKEPPELGADPYVVRDTVVHAIEAAGGAHLSVTGLPSTTTLDLVYDPDRQQFARRFTWDQDGETRELMQLSTGRVCANHAAATALAALGNNVQGAIGAGERPYSCSTRRTTIGGFVIHGYSLRDPVGRLAGLMGTLSTADLGVETDEDGVVTRHLELRAVEHDASLRAVPTTFDLWVGADLRLVRARFTSLGEGPAHVASFAYDDLAAVTLPPAADRDDFVSIPGSGVPGFGGYLLSQFCPGGTCDPDDYAR